MIMYKVIRSENRIVRADIVRQTAKCVFIDNYAGGEKCEGKRFYFETFEEAKQYLIARAVGRVFRARNSLKKLEAELEAVHKLEA